MAELPPLNALRAFEAAGRRLNFRAAADEMGVTQGAVAQQVRALEAFLGVSLFERLPKGVAFTSAGRGYHTQVAAAFADLRAATTTLRPEPDKVVVSVTPTFAAKWLIPNLPAFSAAHPTIDLRIIATEKLSSFHADGIDLAVRQGPPPASASLEVAEMFRQRIIAVCAPGLLQGEARPLEAEALARLPKLHDAHDLWPAFLRRLSVEDDSGHGVRLSQTALAIDAAVSRQGVALVSAFLVRRELASGALVEVSDCAMIGPQDFYLVARRQTRRSPAVDAAFNWFRSMAEQEA